MSTARLVFRKCLSNTAPPCAAAAWQQVQATLTTHLAVQVAAHRQSCQAFVNNHLCPSHLLYMPVLALARSAELSSQIVPLNIFAMQARRNITLRLTRKLPSLSGVRTSSLLAWALQPTLWSFRPLWARAAWCSATRSIMHRLSAVCVALAQRSRYTAHPHILDMQHQFCGRTP